MAVTQELKATQVRLHNAMAELKEAEKDTRDLQGICSIKRNLIKKLEAKIASLTHGEVVVSEHAIIRFMQRAMGLDIEQIKDKIVGKNKATMSTMPGKYPICEGLQAIVKNGVVVSVV